MTLTATPRQVVLASQGRLLVAPVDPPEPGPDDLLIAPDAVGICGTDIELLDGTMAYLRSGLASFPLVPGHEWTGVVTALGSQVRGFAVGQRVVGECTIGCGSCWRCASGDNHLCPNRTETGLFGQSGALTTSLVYPARTAHRVPDGVSAADAALIEPLAVAYRALSLLPTGTSALGIIGAGTIGLLCALTARALGIQQIQVVEIDPDRQRFARSMGFTVDSPPTERCPTVIEASGNPAGIARAIDFCRDGGSVVLLGLTGKPAVPIDVDRVVVGDITLRGSLGSAGVWPAVIDLVARGMIQPSQLVSHHFALDEAGAAFDLTKRRQPGVRRILLHPNGITADA
jgi:L-iditol 2-dehydrogenase